MTKIEVLPLRSSKPLMPARVVKYRLSDSDQTVTTRYKWNARELHHAQPLDYPSRLSLVITRSLTPHGGLGRSWVS